MQPFVGFAPDIDPTTPGVITECSNIIPTIRGYKAAPSPVNVSVGALPAKALGLKKVRLASGGAITVAGTATKLYELVEDGVNPLTWTEVKNTTGISLAYGWSIDAFGDYVLVTGDSVGLHQGIGGVYTYVTGGPEAKYIAVASGFVMAANIGSEQDRWKCCAYNDHTDWTLSAANQCVTGRLVDSGSRVVGLKALGDRFIIYKDAGIYVGEYVGTPEVWRWNLVQSNIGIESNRSIVDIGNAHLFIGADDFYSFDGIRPVKIDCPLREWFFTNSTYRYSVVGCYDQRKDNVYWFFTDNPTTPYTKAIVFNLKTLKWGMISGEFNYPASLMFNDEAHVLHDGISTFSTTHVLMPHDDISASSTITTGNLGDDTQFATIRRVTPRFIDAPTTATMQLYEDNTYGDSFASVGSPVSLDSAGRFDVLNSSRWHKMKFDFTGDMEIVGARYDLIPDGTE